MHGLNLKIVIWYNFSLCVSAIYVPVTSLLNVFEMIIFDLKYILDLASLTMATKLAQLCLSANITGN